MNCLIKHGTALAEGPDGAQGFTIDTPKAKAIDHGTKFVVSYNKKSEKSLGREASMAKQKLGSK